jgi:hypothetical protein
MPSFYNHIYADATTFRCTLLNEIMADHPGQTKEEEDLPPPGHRRGKKRMQVKSKSAAKQANFKTVCSYFKDQGRRDSTNLMQ